MIPQTVLDFWFAEENRPFLFAKNDEFDAKIRARFFDVWQQAARGELAHWRDTLQGRLAEIILLDQFSRNLFRNSPKHLPKIWPHSSLPKKPSVSPVSPTSYRTNAISCSCR